MHEAAHILARIKDPHDASVRGQFSREEMQQVLTELARIAADLFGKDSTLVDLLDGAHDCAADVEWPVAEVDTSCTECSGTGLGKHEGWRCWGCSGSGTKRADLGQWVRL